MVTLEQENNKINVSVFKSSETMDLKIYHNFEPIRKLFPLIRIQTNKYLFKKLVVLIGVCFAFRTG